MVLDTLFGNCYNRGNAAAQYCSVISERILAMKKVFTLLTAILLLLLLCTVIGAETPTPGTVYHLDFETSPIGHHSGRFTGSWDYAFDGVMSMAYLPYSQPLAGGRDVNNQYFNGDKNLYIPAGDYEVTFWVCDPYNMVKKKADGGSKIIMIFHSEGQEYLFDEMKDPSECGQYTDPTKAAAYKELVDISGGQYLVDATGEKQIKGNATWYQYRFEISLPVEIVCANFYVLQPEACTTHADKQFLIDCMDLKLLSAAETQAKPETEADPAPATPDELYFLDFEKAPIAHTSNQFGGTEDYAFSGKMALYYSAYAHPIPGGRDIEFQYFNGDPKKVIPAGTYLVTFWAADPDGMVEEKPDGRAKIIMTFHSKGQDYLYKEGRPLAECGQYTNPEKAVAYRELVDFHAGQYLVEATGKTEKKGSVTWKQYVFPIQFSTAVSSANFYVQQPWACTTHTNAMFLIDRVEITPTDPSVLEPDLLEDLTTIVEDSSARGNLILVAAVILAGIGIGVYIMISERKRDEKE